jgi:tetratricopeptide (TPR) repeat protein
MLHVLGAGEGRRGRFDNGREALRASSEISEELGLRYMAQWSKRTLGRLELAAGDPEAAEAALRISYAVIEEMGLGGSLGETMVSLADALLRQGRLAEAEELLDGVREEWASGDASVDAPRLAVRARLLAVQGWDAHAAQTADRALRLVRRTDWACLQADTFMAQAEVLQIAGQDDGAVEALREALSVSTGKGYGAGIAEAQAALERLGAHSQRAEL